MNTSVATQKEIVIQSNPPSHPSRDAARASNEWSWQRLIPRRPSEIALLALAVLVILLQLKYLWDVRTTVPLQDDWNFLDNMFRSIDTHRSGAWIFSSPNGHFLVPAALAYLFSLHYWSLDLMPLRLLNFPICLAAFFLTVHVINAEISSRFLRFYLYLGACFIIFSLRFWEHFALACGFAAMLSALAGAIGLYYITKATHFSGTWKSALLMGLVFLLVSVLSLGAGYAAAVAAILLLAFSGLKKFAVSRAIPKYETVIYCLAWMVGLLAIASHPLFRLKSRILLAVFHCLLVAGSAGSSFLDKNSLLAQDVAFVCGVILLAASFLIGVDFLTKPIPRHRLLPTFSIALVLFGMLGCAAVATARSYLPSGEFLNSRYTLYPSLCLLGLLFYFACRRVFLLTHVWCFLAAAYLLSTAKEQQIGFYRPRLHKEMERTIGNVENLSDEQLRATLYWRENTKGVRRVVARMRRDRLNVFRGSANPSNGPR